MGHNERKVLGAALDAGELSECLCGWSWGWAFTEPELRCVGLRGSDFTCQGADATGIF